MSGFEPLIAGAMGAAGSMAVQKAGNALMPQNQNMMGPAPAAGGNASPALSILQALQQQMHSQEQQRQQAIMALLMQPPAGGMMQPGAVQMESRR